MLSSVVDEPPCSSIVAWFVVNNNNNHVKCNVSKQQQHNNNNNNHQNRIIIFFVAVAVVVITVVTCYFRSSGARLGCTLFLRPFINGDVRLTKRNSMRLENWHRKVIESRPVLAVRGAKRPRPVSLVQRVAPAWTIGVPRDRTRVVVVGTPCGCARANATVETARARRCDHPIRGTNAHANRRAPVVVDNSMLAAGRTNDMASNATADLMGK